MRPFERRAASAYPYYRLAIQDPLTFCLRQLPGTFATIGKAKADAKTPGQYAISVIEEDGTRRETERFEVK